MIKISVIIITKDRPKELKNCLQSLSHQTCFPSEVIVVDNGQDNGTKQICQILKNKLPIKYLKETRPGCGYARKKGYSQADGDLIFFLDDDCFAPPNWVDSHKQFHQQKNEASAIGGPLLFKKNHWVADTQQKLMDDFFQRGTGLILTSENNQTLKLCTNLLTANISYKKSHLDSVGGWVSVNPSGEDSAQHIYMRRNGLRLYFSENLAVEHDCLNSLDELFKKYKTYGYHSLRWRPVPGPLFFKAALGISASIANGLRLLVKKPRRYKANLGLIVAVYGMVQGQAKGVIQL